ncbi:MAG: class I adenylate-forming enzyme family protein, partial [Rhodospirillaceae bacterium]
PITHRNFAVRVARVAQWFDLTPADRSLCIMPLVHHSGLSNHLIVPLLTGGSTVLADGPEPGHVLDMIVRHRPTWFSASPTIVAALVDRAKAEPARIAGHALRFIRVATAAAPAALLADVERLFGIPAVQNYGLTETGTIVSNPLPPRARRRDTVGLAVGDAVVAVVDDDGRPLPPGGVGEIVVGDDGVMGGYDGEPPRSPPTFLDGRFRTGDLGTFDPDGHLRLVGRRKEAIKRGGATIAPAEVDAVLAAHPDVAAAAAFALPHPTLGEEVYAAIVLRPGATTAPDTILRDAGGRLSPAHRPKQVFVVDALPQTAIGKPLRHALAQRFAGAAVRSGAAARAPLDPMESMVAGLWAHALGQDQVDPDRGFAAQGGDAQRAAALAAALYAALDMDVPAAALMHPGTTVRTIAASARPRPARPL